ncbi:hypothetical protein [Methanothrix sp.]|uniref:hypothetical protein n=1 Tax=Methanothrix sp. TaxID=90426 RepID=UPI00329A6708
MDIRHDQCYLAEHDLFPCGESEESRFSPDFPIPLNGPERTVIADLMELISSYNPDLVLFPYADSWVPAMVRKAERYGLEPAFSRSGWFKSMASKSYWSYGRANHKESALIPEGRVLIDTAKSFVKEDHRSEGLRPGWYDVSAPARGL